MLQQRVVGHVKDNTYIRTFYGWGYQDFTAGTIAGVNVTLTANQNGTDVVFENSKIISSTAVIVRKSNTDSFAYTGITRTFSTRVVVNSQIEAVIVLNGIPDVSWGDLRIYYMYTYDRGVPAGFNMAPMFIRNLQVDEMANFFIVDPTTAVGDIIYRGAGGITKLSIGTEGEDLTVVSGLPAWQNDVRYWGDPTVDGSWKQVLETGELVLYYRNGGNWIEYERKAPLL